MYIRNSRGQLVWIPSQDAIQAMQVTMQSMQQNMRHQMQRDEWTRFNAPPADDNLCFEDQYSVYEGSLSHGYHNVVYPNNSNAMTNNGNMLYHGQQPYNRIDPPIPQVIHSTSALQGPHQNAGLPQVIQSKPEVQGNAQNSGVPRVIHPVPGQSSGSRQNKGIPRVIHSTPAHPGPARSPRPIHSLPPVPGHRQNSGMPRGIQSPPPLSAPRENPGIHQAINPPSEISGPTQNTGIPRINSIASLSAPNQNVGTDRYSQFMKSQEVSTSLLHPAQNNINVIEEEIVHFPHNHNDVDEVDEEIIYDPSHHKINVVEEEFIPDRSCMGTFFGSSIGLYDFKSRSRKDPFMNCNALNISISTSDEDDIGTYLSASFSHKHKNPLQCNGVRGSGKRFDYSGANKFGHLNTQSDSKSFESRTNREEQSFAASTNREEQSLATSKYTLQVDATRTTESKRENEENIEKNVTQKLLREDTELESMPSSRKESTASNSSLNVINESQKSFREESELDSLPSSHRENMGSYSSMIAVGELGSIIEESDSIDQILATEDEIQQIKERQSEDDSKTSCNLDEVRSRKEEPTGVLSKVDPPRDDFLTQLIKKNENFIGNRVAHEGEHSKIEGNENGVSKKFDTKVANNYIVKDYPSFDEHPSFDEPAKPKKNDVINLKQSVHAFPSAESPNEGENTQRNANLLPSKEKISVSKRYMLRSRTARRHEARDEV